MWQELACPQSNLVTLAMLNTRQGKLWPPLEQPGPACAGGYHPRARDSLCPWGSPQERPEGWILKPGLLSWFAGWALREGLQGFSLWFLAADLDGLSPTCLPLHITGLLIWEWVACQCKWCLHWFKPNNTPISSSSLEPALSPL